MKLLKILPIILLLIFIPAKSFADAPKISYGQSSFNFLKGYYLFKDNVKISINNHGFSATLGADEAKVSLLKKKCVATGNVTMTQENFSVSCDSAFSEFDAKNVIVVGKVNFQSKDNITITADSATFNWDEKIADFYGNVKLKTEKNFIVDENLKPKKNSYDHVRYNVEENKILQLDKKFDVPVIVIPDFDED